MTDTRRALLVAGAAGAAVAAVPALGRPGAADAKGADDAAVLDGLIEIELANAVAYRSLAGGDLLEPEVQRAAELFAEQSSEHVDALTAGLEDLGGSPPEEPRAAEVEGLSDLDSQSAALELLIERENETVAAYDRAATELDRPELLKTGAQIVANAAQHLVVLRQQLGDDPVPSAFERGES